MKGSQEIVGVKN